MIDGKNTCTLHMKTPTKIYRIYFTWASLGEWDEMIPARMALVMKSSYVIMVDEKLSYFIKTWCIATIAISSVQFRREMHPVLQMCALSPQIHHHCVHPSFLPSSEQYFMSLTWLLKFVYVTVLLIAKWCMLSAVCMTWAKNSIVR